MHKHNMRQCRNLRRTWATRLDKGNAASAMWC